MPVMKTPGVYIVEKNAFPNSIVEVATAVPAFVGYTEHASDNGKPLKNVPYRISSMAEFERYFGGPPPATFAIEAPKPNTAGDFVVKKGATSTPYDLNLTTTQFRLYFAMKHFFQNYGGACWIVSVGDYGLKADGTPSGEGEIKPDDLKFGIGTLALEQEPTMLVIPDAMGLKEEDVLGVQQEMLTHCGYTMQNRFAILDIWGATGAPSKAQNQEKVDKFRGGLGTQNLMYGAAYYPWVHTRIITESDLSYRNFGGDIPLDTVLLDILPAFADVLATDAKKTPEALLDEAKAASPAADPEAPTAEETAKQKLWVATREGQTNDALRQGSARYEGLLQLAARKINLMPPSAAMAGLYTMTDNTRGVWKAPANISPNNVLAPAVAISHADQENLNVDAQGKSINAIRTFIGEGTLVWGARTLAGNSLDWRYINVRRTMIMLEESCKLAAKAMVFEPNTAGTWLTIKSMIQNFLTGIWRRGGLMGAIPDDAFSVHCGLGETMTPEDVLEGILRVTVLVCMVRPAEFIEITFQQLMPKS